MKKVFIDAVLNSEVIETGRIVKVDVNNKFEMVVKDYLEFIGFEEVLNIFYNEVENDFIDIFRLKDGVFHLNNLENKIELYWEEAFKIERVHVANIQYNWIGRSVTLI